MTDLHWFSAENLTLAAALSAAVLPETAIGMVSTTSWHGFVTLDGPRLISATGEVDSATVFEARFFADGPVELRWLHDRAEQGTAVLLAEDPDPRAERFGSPHTQPIIDTVEQTMLLWGTRSAGPDRGWTTLREHRIGALPVPGLPEAPSSTHRAALRVREYLAEDRYGNAHVIDELLLGLTWQPTHTWQDRKGSS